MTAAVLRHATHPNRSGADVAILRLWALHYEARCAVAESNSAYAQTLLPTTGATETPGAGLPLVPAGVLWQVDAPGAPGTITLTVDIAGAIMLLVLPPNAIAAIPVPVTLAPTRATAVFQAPVDGLYKVSVQVGGRTIVQLYVPVSRAEFGLLREDSRHLAYQFRAKPQPRPGDDYLERLALLAAAEAAAQTAHPELALAWLAAARSIAAPETPTAIYPYRA